LGTSTPIGIRGRKYRRGNTNLGYLHASEVGSIEVMPQVPKGMWPENMREPFFVFRITGTHQILKKKKSVNEIFIQIHPEKLKLPSSLNQNISQF
jgi:hypothetical protein